MKQPNLLLKLGAVVSSVLLAGGYVSYRAGAFEQLTGTSSQPDEVSPDPGTPEHSPPDTTQSTPTIMPGSKSGFDFSKPPSTPAAKPSTTSQQPPSGTTRRRRTTMSGSKSPSGLIRVPRPTPADTQPPATSQPAKPEK